MSKNQKRFKHHAHNDPYGLYCPIDEHTRAAVQCTDHFWVRRVIHKFQRNPRLCLVCKTAHFIGQTYVNVELKCLRVSRSLRLARRNGTESEDLTRVRYFCRHCGEVLEAMLAHDVEAADKALTAIWAMMDNAIQGRNRGERFMEAANGSKAEQVKAALALPPDRFVDKPPKGYILVGRILKDPNSHWTIVDTTIFLSKKTAFAIGRQWAANEPDFQVRVQPVDLTQADTLKQYIE